jgi:hypothetical protein
MYRNILLVIGAALLFLAMPATAQKKGSRQLYPGIIGGICSEATLTIEGKKGQDYDAGHR